MATRRKPIIVSTRSLKLLGACPDQVKLFRSVFGVSVRLNKRVLIRAAREGLNIQWWAYCRLTEAARRTYDEAVATARRAYSKAVATANRDYNEAVVTARRAYNEAIATALWSALRGEEDGK